jgi:LPS-assembly lipoprotein
MKRRALLLALPTLALAGCGFTLRGESRIPFTRLHLDAPGLGSAEGDGFFASGAGVARKLRTALLADGKTRLVADPAQAEATVRLTSETRGKSILALSGAGRVKEYRLSLRLTFSVLDPAGRPLVEPTPVELFRDFTYDDAQLLAKAAEEDLLYRDMEDDAVRLILRRLRSLPVPR